MFVFSLIPIFKAVGTLSPLVYTAIPTRLECSVKTLLNVVRLSSKKIPKLPIKTTNQRFPCCEHPSESTIRTPVFAIRDRNPRICSLHRKKSAQLIRALFFIQTSRFANLFTPSLLNNYSFVNTPDIIVRNYRFKNC